MIASQGRLPCEFKSNQDQQLLFPRARNFLHILQDWYWLVPGSEINYFLSRFCPHRVKVNLYRFLPHVHSPHLQLFRSMIKEWRNSERLPGNKNYQPILQIGYILHIIYRHIKQPQSREMLKTVTFHFHALLNMAIYLLQSLLKGRNSVGRLSN